MDALQAGNGPVGTTRGFADGLALAVGAEVTEATGDGLVVSDGLGVGVARAGPETSANVRVAEVTNPAENLTNLGTN
ncbi:MAG: hypothetical protein ACKOWI_05425 [Rhodoluna sp.]